MIPSGTNSTSADISHVMNAFIANIFFFVCSFIFLTFTPFLIQNCSCTFSSHHQEVEWMIGQDVGHLTEDHHLA